MANSLLKFCAVAFAGSLLGVAYERWPHVKSDPFVTVTADLPLLAERQFEASSGDIIDRSARKPTHVNPKIAAENLNKSSRFGLPSYDNIRLFNDFVLSYDRRLRSPIWVLEHMTPEKLMAKNNVTRKRSRFVEDAELHEYFRATLNDFRNSHYDRGHMAAAANHKLTQDDMDQTFVLSNVSPQEKRFNSGGWERLENYVRWVARQSKNLYVVSGPLYLPHHSNGKKYVTYQVIGENMVSVPTHYFKVFLSELEDETLAMEAFIMPNDPKVTRDIDLDEFRVQIENLDTIERASGVIFFDKLKGSFRRPEELPNNFRPRMLDDNGPESPKLDKDLELNSDIKRQ